MKNITKNKISEFAVVSEIIALFIVITLSITTLFAVKSPEIELGKVEGITIVILLFTLFALYTICIAYRLFKMKYKFVKDYLNNLKSNNIDGLYRKNLNSEIFDCNQAFLNFFGYSDINKVLGRTYFDILSKEETALIKSYEKKVIKDKESFQYEIQVKSLEGEYHTFQVIKSPILDDKNNVIGTSNIARDITKQVLGEKARRTFNETLAHDIKTPLLAQIRVLDFLMEEKVGPLSEEQKTLIKHTISSGHFALEMVMSMLTTYKFSNEEYYFSPVDFNINSIIIDIIDQLKITGFNKNITITYDNSKLSTTTVHADKLAIKRTITNVLFNAISYGAENTEIKVTASIDNENLTFMTENQSLKTDMTKEYLYKMFNKYSFGKKKYKQVGSGLGLFLAKQIVLNHNGKAIYDIEKDDEHYDIYRFGFSIPLSNPELKNKLFKFVY